MMLWKIIFHTNVDNAYFVKRLNLVTCSNFVSKKVFFSEL